MPAGRRFGFHYSLSWHCNARMGLPTLPSCYKVVSFLLLDVTVFCKPMNAPAVTRQLLCHPAFNFRNFELSEIELKLLVGLNFRVTRRSWVDYNLELNAGRIQSLWDEQQWVVTYGGQWRLSRFAKRQPALIFHEYTVRPSGEVRPEELVIVDKASYCGLVRTVWPVWCPYTGDGVASVAGALITYTHRVVRGWRLSITAKIPVVVNRQPVIEEIRF